MPSTELIPITSQKLVREAREFCESITEIVIDTEDQYLNACDFVKKTTGYARGIEKERKGVIAPFNEQVKQINEYFRSAQKPLTNLDAKLRQSIAYYNKEQERKRLDAQRKADEEAERERQRLQDKAKKDAERSQQCAENGDIAGAENYHLRATVHQDMAESVEPVKVQQEPPRVKGVHTREDWSAQVVDKEKFVLYCAQHRKLEYLDINMKLLNEHARQFKNALELPGIKVTVDKTTVVGR